MRIRVKGEFRALGENPHRGGTRKEWIYGTHWMTNNDKNYCIGGPEIIDKHYIHAFFSGDWNMGRWDNIEIDPKTLCRHVMSIDPYIELYEGDQVVLGEDHYCVVWSNVRLCFELALVSFESPPKAPLKIELLKDFLISNEKNFVPADPVRIALDVLRGRPDSDDARIARETVKFDKGIWVGIEYSSGKFISI